MASAVADSYDCESGGVIAGGRNYQPPWRKAMSSRTWALVGNTLASIDPEDNATINPSYPSDAPWHGASGQGDVVGGWSGAAWDEVTATLYVTGGGHAGYAGNELYAWDAIAGTFSLVMWPTGAVGNTGTLADGQDATCMYFDGQPRAAHTYNNLVVVDGVLWHFGGSQYNGGGEYGRPFRWTGTEWEVRGSVFSNSVQGGVCWDSTRELFWVFHSIGAYRATTYDPATQTSTLDGSYVGTSDFCRPHYYAPGDMFVIFCQNTIVGYDPTLQSGDTESFELSIAGTPPSFVSNLGISGSVYDAANNRYLVWGGGTSVYVLTPPATNPLANAWTWSTLSVAGSNTVDPGSRTGAGCFGRFWHSPRLQCCGVFNLVTQQMAVFAL